uniref:Craniofacial development protein 2-like n=1 Tax=Nicotiana tabacum TaxID=4097 RepID=A0A1S3ZSJ3_TOBAC|nr:PREDICTED: uncharacterized protein LOC107789954 [Nicotiana tabacum]
MDNKPTADIVEAPNISKEDRRHDKGKPGDIDNNTMVDQEYQLLIWKFLGFQHCISNYNGQIWYFWNINCDSIFIAEDEQHITIKFEDGVNNHGSYISAVYAKCTSTERKDLWNSLEQDNLSIDGPLYIGGDFNVITNPDKKLGRRPYMVHRCLNFINCMDNCGVIDIGFSGSKFTWCNNRRPSKRIWKILDRIFINDTWDQRSKSTTVRQLARTGFDHRPLLMKRLSQWSREEIGDINDLIIKWAKKVQIFKDMDVATIFDNNMEESNKAHAEYIKWLSMQESFLKQKTQTRWFYEGDSNTRKRRRKQQLNMIKNHRGK